jgi:uncharacterized membrane protein YhaH (DUF805 family)
MGPPAISGRPEAAMDYKWFLFSFEGRISRAKYWLAGLIILCSMFLVLMVLAAVATIFGIGAPLAINVIGIAASIDFSDDPASKASLFPQIVIIPMTLVFGWCYAAASIKRLHDRNKSGWWIVPFIVASGLYGQFGDRLGGSYAAAVIELAVYIAFMWGGVEMCCLKGRPGPTGLDPTRWPPAIRGRAGTSRASWSLFRTVPVHRPAHDRTRDRSRGLQVGSWAIATPATNSCSALTAASTGPNTGLRSMPAWLPAWCAWSS